MADFADISYLDRTYGEYTMSFTIGNIEGVIVKPLVKFNDARGWLCELFREDELSEEFHPVMSYISMTNPGIVRGPHEHVEQADLFGFLGPSTFKVYLWDNRKHSRTFGNKMVVLAGEQEPRSVLIPPGVVHAYKNIGNVSGMVANYPNRLYAGKGKKEKVDEIRHESDPNTTFRLD
jgi:dTDP-4-dehydrorhamnose 3,5-epimerase